jgi:2-polyprenyl-6-methoxyphenol hydroxylase-like FAD-dependent oxidoreductase
MSAQGAGWRVAQSGHAVVIGGSIAGLLAARVLAEHFPRVTLVERDRFPDMPLHRKGLPQSRHLHVLLARGRMALEELFPGIGDELTAAGAELIDAGRDIAWLTPAGWGVRFLARVASFACSRPLLDYVLHRRVSALPQLSIVEDTEVTGLRLAADASRVSGVVLEARAPGAGGAEARVLEADLVIDASGRASRTPGWLANLGCEPPEETVVDAHLGYASRIYERPQATPADWKCLYVQAAPPRRTRGGVAFVMEGGRWMVTLGGIGGDYPPTREAGFLDFMRSLESRALFDSVSAARPLSSIVGYRATGNRWRHYERLAGRPEGLLVMGDAVCAFNPVYGQGMTMAALAALVLAECLRPRPPGVHDGLAAQFQRRLAQINKGPWLLATSEDFRSPQLDGARPGLASRLKHRYLDRLLAHATHDQRLRRTFLGVSHMIEDPSALFHPAVLARVFCRPLPRGTSW